MKERKLNYRFHNPNPTAATADYILKILLEANTGKVQAAIGEAASTAQDIDQKSSEGRPA